MGKIIHVSREAVEAADKRAASLLRDSPEMKLDDEAFLKRVNEVMAQAERARQEAKKEQK